MGRAAAAAAPASLTRVRAASAPRPPLLPPPDGTAAGRSSPPRGSCSFVTAPDRTGPGSRGVAPKGPVSCHSSPFRVRWISSLPAGPALGSDGAVVAGGTREQRRLCCRLERPWSWRPRTAHRLPPATGQVPRQCRSRARHWTPQPAGLELLPPSPDFCPGRLRSPEDGSWHGPERTEGDRNRAGSRSPTLCDAAAADVRMRPAGTSSRSLAFKPQNCGLCVKDWIVGR